ncbi:hypothetical protein OGAPHI_006608 [Ogataea philodendri]|uniref:Uncharacterized protein n=1 Tax=Ogataea philodendri TaxID=1378263 RepID=A0A9P8T096_9ASCO|nr:uncharacterized protein OGAPHI_006608 [Ogataea philodendri]KAH3661201.1 hypothetical protein OGAPHI_006608 [Ogataea philodendri]
MNWFSVLLIYSTLYISSVLWNVNLASVDGFNDSVRVLTSNSASNRLSSTKDLLGNRSEVLTERLFSHGSGNLPDLFKLNVTGVLHVLLLLSVSRWLLQSSDHQRGGRWHNRGLSLSVLDSQLHSNLDTLELGSGLGNIFTNLLWGKTKRTDLWGKSGRGSHFTTNGSQVDEFHFVRVELWRHVKRVW